MSLVMDQSNRPSILNAVALPGRAWRAGLAFGTTLVLAGSAQAEMREYRILFEPSASSQAAGYAMHIGPDTGGYLAEFDLGKPPAQGGTIVYAVDLEDSMDLYVALSAYDDKGESSLFSNEIRVEAVIAPEPAPPPPDDGGAGSGDGGTGGGSDPGTGGGTGGTGGGEPLPPPAASITGTVALSADEAGSINRILGDGGFDFLTVDSLASVRDLRPARCDLDADGDLDWLIGFGYKSAGQIALVEMDNGSAVSVDTLTAGTAAYRDATGGTYPSCGDIDGDGRNEIVVGFGRKGKGVVQIFDDATTGYLPWAENTEDGGMILLETWRHYERQGGDTHPALGDIDGDGRAELVIGLGRYGGGVVMFLGDAVSGFAAHPALPSGERWIQVAADALFIKKFGATFPAVGDWDGDGVDEIAVGLGKGGAGVVAILGDAQSGFPTDVASIPTIGVGRDKYNSRNGEARPSLGDLDDDGIDELVVGFAYGGKHEVQVLDDLQAGAAPMGTAEGFISTGDAKAILAPSPGP